VDSMKKKLTIIFVLGIFLLVQPMSAQTWTTSKRLTWNSSFSGSPDITTDSGNNIHIVWEDDTTGQYEIYYKKGKQ